MIKQININRWNNTWRLVEKGKTRAYKVFEDLWHWRGKSDALRRAKDEAVKWAIRNIPADIVVHNEDGTVADWYELRRRGWFEDKPK